MPEPVRVRILRSTAELERFAPAWRALWEADPHATPFQHPSWLLPWWRQFGQAERHSTELHSSLRAAALSRGPEPIGLLPLYIYPEPRTGERKLLSLGVGTTDYLGGVFRPECTARDIRGALDLLAEDTGWDRLDVLQLRAGSRLAETFGAMPEAQQFAAAPCWRTSAVPISKLPAKLRRHVMYYRNRAARSGELSLEFSNAATLPAMFDDLVRLHTQRWQQSSEPGIFADPRMIAWHREALPELEAAGLLRLCALRRSGETLATAYALSDPVVRADQGAGRAEYVYITAYSVDHANLRPGTILLALAMEQAANEGVATIDMLRGDEGYKQLWHMTPVATSGYRLVHPKRAAAAA
jgi:CelD/BcsL family acetyltransferase involved in cellulose biosynthesis